MNKCVWCLQMTAEAQKFLCSDCARDYEIVAGGGIIMRKSLLPLLQQVRDMADTAACKQK